MNQLSPYYPESGLHIITGIVLGLLIENVCKKIQSMFKLSPLLMVVIQLFMIVTILFTIETYISQTFGYEWQNNTYGLIFVALFFNLQANLINNINALYPF